MKIWCTARPLTLIVFSTALAANPMWAQSQQRLKIADGTPVQLRLDENVSSAHARVGDHLSFVVVRDVTVQGLTVIAAGSKASGSVQSVKGRRMLGMGGNLVIKLDSVKLAAGGTIGLSAHKEVKGRGHTRLMVVGMAVTGTIFWPKAPVFLLTHGDNCTALKGTEVTAQVKGDTFVAFEGLPLTAASTSDLNQVLEFLPPRVLNGEGRQGDMVNLIFIGQPAEVRGAFDRAGWIKTDKWKPLFVWHLMRERTHYARLPMARFYLFGRSQDYSYALPDPVAIVSRRHDVRIWKTDHEVDGQTIWVAAATHDVAIEIAKRGKLINHRIDPNVDLERDFIGANLSRTDAPAQQSYLTGTDPVFQAQTASGEAYYSDSRILLVDLRHTENSESTRRGSEPLTDEATAGGLVATVR